MCMHVCVRAFVPVCTNRCGQVDIDDPDFWSKAVGFDKPVDIEEILPDDGGGAGVSGRRRRRRTRRRVQRMGMVDTLGKNMADVFEDTESDEDDLGGADNLGDTQGAGAGAGNNTTTATKLAAVDDWESFANFYAGVGAEGEVLDFAAARSVQRAKTVAVVARAADQAAAAAGVAAAAAAAAAATAAIAATRSGHAMPQLTDAPRSVRSSASCLGL